MQEALQSVDLNSLGSELLRIIRDPYSNFVAALMLLAMVLIFILIIAGIVFAIVGGRGAKKRSDHELQELQYLLAVLEAEESGEEGAVPEVPVPVAVPGPTFGERMRAFPWLAATAITFAVVVVTGMALGATTASSTVCSGCHIGTPHNTAVRAGIADPHSSVGCVRCHESSGPLGSVTLEVPGRFVHFVNGLKKNPAPTQYGAVVSAPCLGCHRTIAQTTTIDEERGVKMAHKQPLEAGAECRDCHSAATGVVSSLTVGMAPCLRCHDGENQPATCATCHTKDVGLATRSHVNPAEMRGRELIETPDCGGCHDQEKNCDPCHAGARMPHTDLFLAYGHAREGVKDLWNNNGQKCGRCHTAERRPCTKCHAAMPGHPINVWPTLHGNNPSDAACSCHNNMAYVAGRDLCELCHSEPFVTQ